MGPSTSQLNISLQTLSQESNKEDIGDQLLNVNFGTLPNSDLAKSDVLVPVLSLQCPFMYCHFTLVLSFSSLRL